MKQDRTVSFFQNQSKTKLNYVIKFPFDRMFITVSLFRQFLVNHSLTIFHSDSQKAFHGDFQAHDLITWNYKIPLGVRTF